MDSKVSKVLLLNLKKINKKISLTGWNTFETGAALTGPVMTRTILTIVGPPRDTFINMQNWGRGSLFVNGLHIGRYFHAGPQITSYVPAPLLREGANEVKNNFASIW